MTQALALSQPVQHERLCQPLLVYLGAQRVATMRLLFSSEACTLARGLAGKECRIACLLLLCYSCGASIEL